MTIGRGARVGPGRGILLLLLLTGMETDLKLAQRVGRAAISISLSGVAVPFACGVALGILMPESLLPAPDQRLLTALFLGTALSISSIKIVAAVVREMNFTRRTLASHRSSAIIGDTIGWIIIAIISASRRPARSRRQADPEHIRVHGEASRSAGGVFLIRWSTAFERVPGHHRILVIMG
jgi:Kef-type K+ transport system membrane component KefB